MSFFNLIISIVLTLSSLSCVQYIRPIAKINLPRKNYVKVVRTLQILECKKVKNTPCQEVKFTSTGSGLSLGPVTSSSTGSLVLTAGHMCETKINKQALKLIKEYKLIIMVIDVKNMYYSTSTILSTNGGKDLRDLCLLKVPDLRTGPIKYSLQNPEIGEHVYNMASPLGVFHPPTVPILHGIYSGPVNKNNSLTTIAATGGSSGSPVFNSNGELVGILFAATPNFPNISLISNRDSMINFILDGLKLLTPDPSR